MSESLEICIHELSISSCSYCKHSKSDLPKFVYVTKGGDVFHKRKDCEALASGQNFANNRGQQTYEIEQVAMGSTEDRGMCEWCFSSHFNRPLECMVRVDNTWISAKCFSIRSIGHGHSEYMVQYQNLDGKVMEKGMRKHDVKVKND